MAEVLSQNEIDELLKSIASDPAPSAPASNGNSSPNKGEDEEGKAWKKYDFSSPKKFNKDRLKHLKSVYDNYARLLTLRLNGLLRTVCEVEIISVEEQRYFEFSNMLTDTDVIMIMNTKAPGDNMEFPILFHINPALMLNMIDRMMGGTGDEDDLDIDPQYEYTDIELVLYEKAMGSMLDATANAWSNYLEIALGERYLESNPALFQEISLDEPVVIVIVNLKINNLEGVYTICIPGSLLTDIFTVVDKKRYTESIYGDALSSARERILASIKRSTLDVRAKLGGAVVNIEDIYRLKVGDVIDLNKPKDSEITVYVEGQPWFEGKMGAYNKNTAIQICRRLGENGEPLSDNDIEEIPNDVDQTLEE